MVQSSRKRSDREAAGSEAVASPAVEDTDDRLEIDLGTSSDRRVDVGRVSLWVGATLVGLIHYWIADPQQGPRIFADEVGYLANARYLAGGRIIDMSHTAFYAGGFSLAITPLSRLFAHDPGRLYASIIVMQSVLAGLSIVLMAQLCRWLFATRWSVSIIAACVAGLYPAFVINTGFAWSESMLTFALLVAISAGAWLMRSLDGQPRRRRTLPARAALTGLACGYVVTVHNRTSLAMLVVVVIIGIALARRHAPAATAALGVAFIATCGAGQVLNRHLNHALWGGGGGIDASGKITDLFTPHGLWAAIRVALGQSWYQIVATGGFVAIALTALAIVALRRASSTDADAGDANQASSRSTVALTVFAAFTALLAVSAVFTANGTRSDTMVYGRYIDIATPLLVAIAITWLSSSPRPRSLRIAAVAVAGTATAGFLVLHFGARLELARPYNRATTMAIFGWLDPKRGRPMLFVPTLWAIAISTVAIAIAYAFRRPSKQWWIGTATIASIIVCLFAWQLTFAHPKFLSHLAAGAANTRAMVRDVKNTGTSELGLDQSMTVVDKLALAYWLPDTKFVATTPTTVTCSHTVSISHATRPLPGQVQIASVGPYHLFRGLRPCPA